MVKAKIAKGIGSLLQKEALKRGVKQSTLDNSFFGHAYRNDNINDDFKWMIGSKNPLGEKKPSLKSIEEKEFLYEKEMFRKMIAEDSSPLNKFSPPVKQKPQNNFSKNTKHYEDLSVENKDKMEEVFRNIDKAGGKGTYSKAALKAHIGRILSKGKIQQELPEDAVVDHIIKQINPLKMGSMISQRKKSNPDIRRSIKSGLLKESDRPEISHVIPVSEDWTKALEYDNLFYGSKKSNREALAGRQEKQYNYIDELQKNIINYDLMDKYSLSKGGLVKKGIQSLLDSTTFNQSRRKFLKQAGTAALATTLPIKTLASLAPKVAQDSVTRMAPPWIKSMVGVLNKLSGPNFQGRTLPNGTVIRNFGKKGSKQEFEITNSDGYKVPVNMTKEKDGNLHIEFDIRDEFNNNQHIYMDKKTGAVEIVDENYYMTSPEDYAKDDPISWDVSIPSQMQEYEKKMGVMKGDVDDYMLDYASTPEGGDYSDLFESFVDSFSPSGSIFKTKQKAEIVKNEKIQKETYKRAQSQKQLEDEEMRFEEQFRGGNMHGYKHGGFIDRWKELFSGPDYENLPAQANNWLAIQGNDKWDGLSKDQSRHDKLLSFDGPEYGIRASIISLASRAARKNNSSKLNLNQIFFEKDAWAEDQSAYRSYFKDLGIPTDTVYDMSNREDVFSLVNTLAAMEMGKNDYNSINTQKRDKIFNDGIDQAYERLNNPDYNYYSTYKNKFNNGGLARRPEALPPLKGPDPLAKNLRADVDNIIQFPQKFAGGGIVKKLLAPNVLGKLTNFKPQISGATKIKASDFVGPQISADRLPPVEPGAMVWGSREKIIDSPMQQMKGSQWLNYLKKPSKNFNPVKDMELNDTSLSTHLSRESDKLISKEQLIKDFDTKLAPDIEVVSFGANEGASKSIGDTLRMVEKIDTQALRDPREVNVLTGFRNQLGGLKEEIDSGQTDALMNRVLSMEKLVEQNYGIKNSFTGELPQKFPFELKKIINEMASDLKLRQYGFDDYKKGTQYAGQQTLGGGQNYREFLFKSKNKPGSARSNEPVFSYSTHNFGLNESDRAGGFLHMRTSDRTDEFGRKILFIEEIQSDMHQRINMAKRSLKKKVKAGQDVSPGDLMSSKYAERGDVVKQVDDTGNEQQMMLIQSKIEELLAQPQNKQTQIRLVRLNKERAKVRKIISDNRAKASQGDNTGVPEGPLSKTEDYNEFAMKYAAKVAEEGGYDGVSIASAGIKNRNMTQGGRDYTGNLTAYGPIAEGAMKKTAKKTGANYLKTAIVDEKGRGWEIPMILLKDNAKALNKIRRGTPIYKKGGIVKGNK